MVPDWCASGSREAEALASPVYAPPLPPIRSIAILLHERDHGAIHANYRIWSIAENWKRRGVRVDVLLGPPPSGNIDADLLVPHIDLSYVPDHLWRVIEAHPRAINKGRRDIRKRTISPNLVARDGTARDPISGSREVYPGPVIVKTNNNCGGWGDDVHDRSLLARVRRRLIAKARKHPTYESRYEPWLWPVVRTLRQYPIFDSVREVPRGVWLNPHLVVEKYLPERAGEGPVGEPLYVMRMWIVLGERALGRTLTSPDPYVKGPRSVLAEMPEAPPEVRAWARGPTLDGSHCLHLDYGKIDYLMHAPGETSGAGSSLAGFAARAARPILIDVNTTPTVSGDARSEHYIAQNAKLAEGIALWEG
jgi:hypothetical protein